VKSSRFSVDLNSMTLEDVAKGAGCKESGVVDRDNGFLSAVLAQDAPA
jgi:hypothetical protein